MSGITTTPPEITRAVRRLTESVVRGAEPVYLDVQPEADAIVHECFPNVQAKVARDGGQMLCGWQLWEWPHVLVEAEFHAVLVSPAGEMVDITPKPEGETRILFVPDPRRRYEGLAIDNVRMPLRDDLLIKHFIQMSEAIVQVMNRGERSSQYGEVSVPANEIQPLLQARDFLGQSLGAGLREHAPCLCGSGSKYKRCHGAQVEAFFRR
ncbi:SEC-C domain-containing protein [Xanthomonas phaseoli]|uniref:SEC-C domain-containing protein n=1 Tax=Xanthomonas phaseoli TaxID=1985254 RepID=UPI001ADD3B3C|nr:SEC-C domain-containing protein [Xanthomonas phaseoli]MBO9792755.1 SEC-C domain-containing protein [Xanthomonas phaseoli pv. dieffenbachiae]